MAYEQKDNEGVLFKNEDKKTDKHPDYKGWGEVGGVAVWIAAWIKTGKKGKFMSLAFTPKDQQRGSTNKRAEATEDRPF